MDYFALSSGLNVVSHIPQGSNAIGNSYGYQINLTYQKYFGYEYIEPTNSIEFGLSYELEKYDIQSSSNNSILLESSYITFPIKYQYNIIDLEESIPISVLLGGFYSFKLDESSIDKEIGYLPNSNYGIILGTRVFHYLYSGMYFFIEYNFQYGFASTQNTVVNYGNVSHLINFGFKLPSTIF